MPRFEIETRYANLLFVLGVTFLYSSGIPVLYPIACVFFLVGYWVDKILLLRYSQRPEAYDESMAMRSLNWFKFIILMHIVAGTVMYANSAITPSRYLVMESVNTLLAQASTEWQIRNFFQLHIFAFVGLLALLIAIYILWLLIVRFAAWCRSFCGIKQQWEQLGYEGDFYKCVDFRSLI